MKLTEVIRFLITNRGLVDFYLEKNLNRDSEALLIYQRDFFGLESETEVFEIEETADELVFIKDGVKYVQLFPLEYAKELIGSDLGLSSRGYTDLEYPAHQPRLSGSPRM